MKPPWSSGAAAPLRKKAKTAHTAPATAPTTAPKGNVWTLGGDDLADDGLDLVDEDALLDHEEEKVVVEAPPADCGTAAQGTKRKACKNCSCGLAELEESGNADKAPPVSACGSVSAAWGASSDGGSPCVLDSAASVMPSGVRPAPTWANHPSKPATWSSWHCEAPAQPHDNTQNTDGVDGLTFFFNNIQWKQSCDGVGSARPRGSGGEESCVAGAQDVQTQQHVPRRPLGLVVVGLAQEGVESQPSEQASEHATLSRKSLSTMKPTANTMPTPTALTGAPHGW